MRNTIIILAFAASVLFSACKDEKPAATSSTPAASPPSTKTVTPTPDTTKISSPIISFAISCDRPPYVLLEQFATIDPYAADCPPLGFEVDIIKTALTRAGYILKPSFQPQQRCHSELIAGTVDAAVTAGAADTAIFYSQPVSYHQNIAISRKAENLVIKSISDLKPLRCLAFQGASAELGPEFTAMAKDNTRYSEYSRQSVQLRLFADRKADVIIFDKYIFAYIYQKHIEKTGKKDELAYHEILSGVNPSQIGFRNKDVRDAFDEQLIRMFESRETDRLIAKYFPERPIPPPVQAVSVIFGVARPPFVMDQERRGISIDLVAEIFRRLNLPFRSSFAPNQRMEAELASGSVQVAVEVTKSSPDIFYSDQFIQYDNVVASRISDNIDFKAWTDLASRRVCAWQLAEKNFQHGFDEAKKSFTQYTEFPDQHYQVLQWAAGKFDAIVIDKTMLFWHLNGIAKEFPALHLPKPSEIKLQPVPVAACHNWFVGFRDQALCDRFNQTLKEIRQDGTYQRILSHYIPNSPVTP